MYRLGRVVKVYPDEKNVVRTVRLIYRRKNSREQPLVCKTRPLVEEDVGVQRLALLQSVSEQVTTDVGD